jgi:hypothetical protein
MKYNLPKILTSVILLGIFAVIVVNPVEAATVNVTSPTSLTTGLVGWWTMDGPNMLTNVKDSSSNGNNGVMSGFTSTSTAVVPGKIGQGLKFDGVNDYVNLGSNSTLDQNGQMSISAWIKPSIVTVGTMDIICNRATNGDYCLELNRTAGRLTMVWSNSVVSTNDAGATLLQNKWYHVVMVRSGSAGAWTVTYYINGVVGDADVTSTNPDGTNVSTNIGANNGSSQFFNGLIDDVRIYNRALSATEVLQLYNTTVGSKQAASPNVTATSTCSTGLSCGLVGYWTFDGPNMLTNVKDSSGSNNNGVMSGFTSTSTAVVPGKIGQGLKFDGVDDYVRVAAPNMTGVTSISESAWVYVAAADFSGRTYVIADDEGDNFNNHGIGFYLTDNGGSIQKALMFELDVSTGNCVGKYANNVFGTRRWYHVAMTYDGNTSTSKLYVDGISVSFSSNACSGSGAFVPNSSNLYIGALNTGSSYLKGTLDDVRIYNRALSATEITQLYNSTVGSKQAASPNVTATSTCSTGLSCGLVGYWTFDGPNMLTNVKDVSGNGNNGFMSGFTSTSTAVVPGKIGQGLKFDGVDDHVISGNISAIDNIPEASFCAWVRLNNAATSNQTVIGKWGVGLVFQSTGSSGNIRFGVSASSVDTNTNVLVSNVWQHWCATFSNSAGTNKHKVYVNGILQTVVTASGSPDSETATGNGGFPLDIGRNNILNRFLKGSIDDVRVYNRTLSVTEIRQLYNLGR